MYIYNYNTHHYAMMKLLSNIDNEFTCGHYGTHFFSAKLSDGSIEHVNLVEEVDCIDSHPLIQVFALGQDHRQS